MRITIVQGPFFPVPPVIGGAVEKAWFDLGCEFALRGHQVVHVSRQFRGLAGYEQRGGVKHVRVKSFDAPRSLILQRLFDLIYALRTLRVLPAADIVVTNSVWLPILLRRPGYGRLYVHVGRYPKHQFVLYRHAARLQTVSAAVAEAITRQTPSCANLVKVIPYPLASVDIPVKATDYWMRREEVLLYIGRVHPEKGLEILLEAFTRLTFPGSTWRLRIIGSWETSHGGGGKSFYTKLQKIAARGQRKVEWLGPIFDREVLDRYCRRAGLFVYPSLAEHGESFGLAPLEAMARGCPALVSRLGCFEDYITDRYSGFVFDHRQSDPAEDLARRMDQISRDRDGIARIGENALRSAARFNLPRVAQMYLEDFASLLESSDQAESRAVAN